MLKLDNCVLLVQQEQSDPTSSQIQHIQKDAMDKFVHHFLKI